VSDIDTAVVDSLKVLDLKRPIREADIGHRCRIPSSTKFNRYDASSWFGGDMRRRDFIVALGGAVVAWPLAAHGQQGERVRRIGVLMNFAQSDQGSQSWLRAFRPRLEELGWKDGGNVRIDDRWAAGDRDLLRSYAADLVSLKPDVLLGVPTPSVTALQQASRTIPIVFVGANDPIGSGFVASLARPGGNITGFVDFEAAMGGKWLETLKEISPDIASVALIYNPKTHTGQYFPAIETAAASLAIRLARIPHHSAAEIERGISDFARDAHGGILGLPDSSNIVHRDLIIRLAVQHRLPAVYSNRLYVASGGLAFYGTERKDLFQKAAGYVDRILRGVKPTDLPVQTPTKFEMVINIKAAKAINLTVSPTLLARADEVIE
jgi:putative ABC transport system substrate-binding protein